MTDRTLHLPVAAQPDVETLVDHAVRGEDCGYDRAWLPETWGRDAVAVLTRMATETDEIGLGPSICNVYSRSPALLAQTATTLQEIADGRVRFGIGPSGPAVIEGWHGADFDRPLRRTRETLEIMRAVMSGETVDYDGEVFTLGGFRMRCEPPAEPVPIDVAGMGPKSVELAGRFADGWHAIVFTPDGLRERLADLRRGIELGGRDPGAVRTTLSVTACALADGERARELVARHIAFYVGAMGTYYRESLARQGYADVAAEVATAWGSGDRERATALVASELLAELGVAGTPEQAREQLARFEAIDGLDAVAVSFPRGLSPEGIQATIEALAP